MAGKPLPLGNKASARNPAGLARFFPQQHPLRPVPGATHRGSSNMQPSAVSTFRAFNSTFRALPFPGDRTVAAPGMPAVPREPLNVLRKRVMQAAKSRGRRER